MAQSSIRLPPPANCPKVCHVLSRPQQDRGERYVLQLYTLLAVCRQGLLAMEYPQRYDIGELFSRRLRVSRDYVFKCQGIQCFIVLSRTYWISFERAATLTRTTGRASRSLFPSCAASSKRLPRYDVSLEARESGLPGSALSGYSSYG